MESTKVISFLLDFTVVSDDKITDLSILLKQKCQNGLLV